ncbi:MAG: hypothetical protein J5883_01675 [Clostridiales bacterium]|nr:hypothetical protein [Clostridiales bacterium]
MLVGKMDDAPYKVGENTKVKASQIGSGSTIDRDSLVLKSSIGENCDIEKRNLIQSSVIGDMTYTGEDTSIMWAEVGKYCCISRMVDIGGNEHDYEAVTMMPSYRIDNKLGGKLSKHPEETMISIGNDVWIGQGVSIVRKEGLRIGNGAVIGSGAVVTRSVPDYAVVAGVPAKVIKYRFPDDIIKRLLELKWWDWESEKILKYKDLLTGKMNEETLKILEG